MSSESVHHILHELKDIHVALDKLKGHPDAERHLLPLQEKLRAIDSRRVDGKFLGHDGSIPPGQAEVVDELERCYQVVIDIENGPESMMKELQDIKSELQKLDRAGNVTHEQLRPLQDRLQKIETRRVEGKFLDSEGKIPPGQAKMVEVLEECHAMKQQIISRIKQS